MFYRPKTELFRKRAIASRYQKPWKQWLFLSFISSFPFAAQSPGYPPYQILRFCAFEGAPVFSRPAHRDLTRPWGQADGLNQYRNSWYLSSVMVLVSWQCLQSGCQLLRSQNSFWSPRWGTMWSTTVALTYFPRAKHRTHSGWVWRKALLSLCHLLPYPRLPAGRFTSGCSDLCSSQYIVP